MRQGKKTPQIYLSGKALNIKILYVFWGVLLIIKNRKSGVYRRGVSRLAVESDGFCHSGGVYFLVKTNVSLNGKWCCRFP
jgi:hypothetical protein